MKTGDETDVRPAGATAWVRCRLDLISSNAKSLAVSTDEALPTIEGFMFDSRTGRQVLLLLKKDGGYQDVVSGAIYEIRSADV
jgi:hypothetical protein